MSYKYVTPEMKGFNLASPEVAKMFDDKINETFRLSKHVSINASETIRMKRFMKMIDQYGLAEHVRSAIPVKVTPDMSPHDAYHALEGQLDDYAKRVVTYAQTLISTVKRYAADVANVFVKKLHVSKTVDTSKLMSVDGSMTMVVMSYADYAEIAHPIVERTQEYLKELFTVLPCMTRVRKAIEKNESVGNALKELTAIVRDGKFARYLMDHSLADIEIGEDSSGTYGIVNAVPSKRLSELEESQTLAAAGWSDVDKVKNSLILKNAEDISKQLSEMYKVTSDIMDEARRISNSLCTKDPYACTVLIKYGSMLAQMTNIYTKVFDMCWTTCLRVTQACYLEESQV